MALGFRADMIEGNDSLLRVVIQMLIQWELRLWAICDWWVWDFEIEWFGLICLNESAHMTFICESDWNYFWINLNM